MPKKKEKNPAKLKRFLEMYNNNDIIKGRILTLRRLCHH